MSKRWKGKKKRGERTSGRKGEIEKKQGREREEKHRGTVKEKEKEMTEGQWKKKRKERKKTEKVKKETEGQRDKERKKRKKDNEKKKARPVRYCCYLRLSQSSDISRTYTVTRSQPYVISASQLEIRHGKQHIFIPVQSPKIFHAFSCSATIYMCFSLLRDA